jgi:hypothetical protein
MNIDLDRVRQLLSYCPESGTFTWLQNRKGGSARIGNAAGHQRPDGYSHITVDGQRHYSHRIAWVIEKGPIPDGMEIDHIDQDPSNNRLSNLRLVTRAVNRKNRSRDSRNKSGVNGVYWASHANAWGAQIRVDRKTTHIGYFKSLAEAAQARKASEANLGFHQNHGRARHANS